MTDDVVLTDSDVSEDEWLLAIGRVVVAASAAEHELGELLITVKDLDLGPVSARAAGQTGAPLVEALLRVRAATDSIASLASGYESLLERRNSLIHGAWILSVFNEFPTITAKRDRKDPDANLTGFIWTPSDLTKMAHSFETLRADARKTTDGLRGLPRSWSESDG